MTPIQDERRYTIRVRVSIGVRVMVMVMVRVRVGVNFVAYLKKKGNNTGKIDQKINPVSKVAH